MTYLIVAGGLLLLLAIAGLVEKDIEIKKAIIGSLKDRKLRGVELRLLLKINHRINLSGPSLFQHIARINQHGAIIGGDTINGYYLC